MKDTKVSKQGFRTFLMALLAVVSACAIVIRVDKWDSRGAVVFAENDCVNDQITPGSGGGYFGAHPPTIVPEISPTSRPTIPHLVTATPACEPPNEPPLILCAGFMGSTFYKDTGGPLDLLALVHDPEDHLVEVVLSCEVGHAIYELDRRSVYSVDEFDKYDLGDSGEPYMCSLLQWTFDFPSLAAWYEPSGVYRLLLLISVVDNAGNESDYWPKFYVKPDSGEAITSRPEITAAMARLIGEVLRQRVARTAPGDGMQDETGPVVLAGGWWRTDMEPNILSTLQFVVFFGHPLGAGVVQRVTLRDSDILFCDRTSTLPDGLAPVDALLGLQMEAGVPQIINGVAVCLDVVDENGARAVWPELQVLPSAPLVTPTLTSTPAGPHTPVLTPTRTPTSGGSHSPTPTRTPTRTATPTHGETVVAFTLYGNADDPACRSSSVPGSCEVCVGHALPNMPIESFAVGYLELVSGESALVDLTVVNMEFESFGLAAGQPALVELTTAVPTRDVAVSFTPADPDPGWHEALVQFSVSAGESPSPVGVCGYVIN